MLTSKEIYDKIHAFYGKSYGWISDLSVEFDFPYDMTRQLCVAAGFYRHKREQPYITLEQFEQHRYVAWRIEKGIIRSSI